MVDREAEAELRQRRQMLALDRAETAQRRLPEFKHERRRQRAIGFEEIEHCAKADSLRKVSAAMLQNTPTSSLRTIRRRSTCMQRSITAWSMRPISPADSAAPTNSSAAMTRPLVAQPRHRLHRNEPCAAAASRSAADRCRCGWLRSRASTSPADHLFAWRQAGRDWDRRGRRRVRRTAAAPGRASGVRTGCVDGRGWRRESRAACDACSPPPACRRGWRPKPASCRSSDPSSPISPITDCMRFCPTELAGDDLALDRGETASEIGHLLGEIAGAARQVLDLAGDIAATRTRIEIGVEENQQRRERRARRSPDCSADRPATVNSTMPSDAAISAMQMPTKIVEMRNMTRATAQPGSDSTRDLIDSV